MSVESLPEWVQRVKIGEGTVTVDHVVYAYHVLSRDYAPKLTGFAGFSAGLLYISEDVPVVYRPYILAHEVREHVLFRDMPNRCRRSLEREFFEVPIAILPHYVLYRYAYFRLLERHYVADPNEDEDLKEEVQASLEYLEEQIATLSRPAAHSD